MENASKALIIAGTILVAILLVTIGIVVVNIGNGNIGQGDGELVTQEAVQFNSRFTSYAGKQDAAAVKQLLTDLVSNNGKTEGGHYIHVTAMKTTRQHVVLGPEKTLPLIINNEMYNVEVDDRWTVKVENGIIRTSGGPDGYIDTVNIIGNFN